MVEDDGNRSDGSPDPDPSRTADAVFEAVADEHRRLALYYLRDRKSAGTDELATVVSGWTRARRPGAGMVTPDDRDEVRVSLHHVHLPKLADAGLVRYDRDAKEATLDGSLDLLDLVLDRSLADERRGSDERIRAASDDRETGDSRGANDDRDGNDSRNGDDSRGGDERGSDDA